MGREHADQEPLHREPQSVSFRRIAVYCRALPQVPVPYRGVAIGVGALAADTIPIDTRRKQAHHGDDECTGYDVELLPLVNK